MNNLDERPWFGFAVSLPHLGPHEPMIDYVPADNEEAARAKMRDTLHPKIAHLAEHWPLVTTRFCTRDALTKPLLRKRPLESNTEGSSKMNNASKGNP